LSERKGGKKKKEKRGEKGLPGLGKVVSPYGDDPVLAAFAALTSEGGKEKERKKGRTICLEDLSVPKQLEERWRGEPRNRRKRKREGGRKKGPDGRFSMRHSDCSGQPARDFPRRGGGGEEGGKRKHYVVITSTGHFVTLGKEMQGSEGERKEKKKGKKAGRVPPTGASFEAPSATSPLSI